MELAELQCSNELKLKFYVEGVSLVDFYKNILNAKNIPTLLIMTKRWHQCLTAHTRVKNSFSQ